ncbi:type IV pilin protein [Vibrio furnissii]|uniref:type IV pilin protein n=1 Tax=Vibrio furnissii TaxID=29494 RepID=UPI00266628A7|nr:type IV pilin protein [Vibrio furnissii]
MEMIRTNRCNRRQSHSLGMTLIELMIAVVIVGVLASIAYPAYTHHVKESHRKQAMADMARIQLYLEEHYNGAYSTSGVISAGTCTLCDGDSDRYAWSVTLSSTGYVITATPQAAKGQDQDQCGDLGYSKLELSSNGTRSPDVCWH